MSWFRYKSLDEGRPLVMCRACGHSNVRHPRQMYSACERCFRDVHTGERHAAQMTTGLVLVACGYLVSALLGVFLAQVFILVPLDIFYDLDRPARASLRETVVWLVVIAGAVAGFWFAHRTRRKQVRG